ncbi:788e2dbd-3988-4b05-9c57-7684a114e56e [Thermothielavioides terrestris]|uniref:788e2dbd-3988-4b05-9c57-7684a114e56e n=1 Tax=Thermothielavioides terrestris TaxID=2587410 RepID=A0A3S4ANA9_9PEZI|nr:788e2dbd-3988-4b05-9c57-7684a114e56e [Thermothielavioides terrestris]
MASYRLTSMRLAHWRLLRTGVHLERLAPTIPLSHTPSQTPQHLPGPPPAARSLTTTPSLSSGSSWLLSALPSFIPNPSHPPPPKTLRARRLLPYAPSQIYTLIADIDAYSRFLPHCTHSRVTRWTTPQPPPSSPPPPPNSPTPSPAHAATTTTVRHPALADLTIGWGPFTQTYTSRVYCVPGSVVEAVSGAAETSIPAAVLRAAGYDVPHQPQQPQQQQQQQQQRGAQGTCSAGHGGRDREMGGDGIFESLVTRWTVTPAAGPAGVTGGGGGGESEKGWTEVALSVTFRFANPALGFAVGQVADEKVGEMVEAFEGRARELFGPRRA